VPENRKKEKTLPAVTQQASIVIDNERAFAVLFMILYLCYPGTGQLVFYN
jgi:hypothetical protein